MKVSRKDSDWRGFSLLEVTVSLAVLAVAIPLSLAAIVGSANSDAASRVESLAPSMVRACLDAWRAAGEKTPAEESPQSPGVEEMRALGITATGEALGEVEAGEYREGCRREGVTYLGKVAAEPAAKSAFARPVRVSLEFPAAARADQRRRMEFFTCLP